MKSVLNVCIFAILLWIVDSRGVSFRPHLDGRIVGGVDATIEQYPYQVSLQTPSGSHFCGGSVISPSVVLTAAHCVQGSSPSSLTVRAGSTTRGSGGVVVAVKRIHVHEKYDSKKVDFDVAVLELSQSLTTSNKIKPVKLPEASEYLRAGESSVASGWGALKQGGGAPTTLQAVKLPILDQGVCNNAYGGGITDRMICAGSLAGGIDSCQGDSGGPLVSNSKQHGIVSWGNGCAQKNYPGVYTRVTAVRAWIKSKVNV
ncbi:trypsin-1-like [Chrysoperla carnea]|uniref:trypsin-1-like n=1 Tax=Chrysoperla carnea TaxID=189513 RepID=UPI001D070BFF|nr:trypsin-1-like [Chrysoperla carnea]